MFSVIKKQDLFFTSVISLNVEMLKIPMLINQNRKLHQSKISSKINLKP